MRFTIILGICLLMAFQSKCQNISIAEQRVKANINSKGDTTIEMSLEDARVILTDLLELNVANAVIENLVEQDSLNTNVITLQKDEIKLLNLKLTNQGSIIDNLNKILVNKDKEISYLNDTIKQQKREIIKQKMLKLIGFTAAVVLPITILLLH